MVRWWVTHGIGVEFHETGMHRRGTAFAARWGSLFSGTLRYTDINQFDRERLSVQKFEWRLSDAGSQINLGDLFANLSPCSLTRGWRSSATWAMTRTRCARRWFALRQINVALDLKQT